MVQLRIPPPTGAVLFYLFSLYLHYSHPILDGDKLNSVTQGKDFVNLSGNLLCAKAWTIVCLVLASYSFSHFSSHPQ